MHGLCKYCSIQPYRTGLGLPSSPKSKLSFFRQVVSVIKGGHKLIIGHIIKQLNSHAT